MKKILTLALAFGCGAAFAQKADNVGIGTSKPDPSAILDLNSNSKGLLLPRMSEAQRNAIKNPAAGLIIFQTDQVVGTYTFDGTAWQPSSARVGSVSAVGAWDLNGNTGVSASNFIGSDAQPIRFKIAGTQIGILAADNFTFMGYESGMNNSGSTHNTAMGFRALKSIVTGIRNVAVGSQALLNNTASDNTAIGFDALKTNTSGNNNVAIGLSSLRLNSGGSFNVGVAAGTLENNTSGSNNVGLGYAAGYSNTTGSNNIALGAYALYSGTAISGNLAIGAEAGRNATGSSSVFIGNLAGYSETGSNKLYVSNSNTVNPLIKGDFSSNWLKINSKTTGYLAVGDFDAGTPMPTPAGYRLIVQDGILTEKLKVALKSDNANWADYVFEPDYKLMPLEKVEEFTKANKHLPNVPSADEITKEGIDVAKVSKMFMEKIEELTLHIIDLNKRIKELEKK